MRLVLRAAHRKLHHNPTECQDCCASNHSLDFYFVNPENGSISVDQLWGRCNLHWKWMKNASEIGCRWFTWATGRSISLWNRTEMRDKGKLVSGFFLFLFFSGQQIDATSEASAHRSVRSSSIDLRPPPRVTIAVPSIHQKLDRFVCSTKTKCDLISMNDLCFHFVIFHKRINLSMKFRWKYANEVRYHLSAAIH